MTEAEHTRDNQFRLLPKPGSEAAPYRALEQVPLSFFVWMGLRWGDQEHEAVHDLTMPEMFFASLYVELEGVCRG
jgi:hypothetical protein